MERDVAGLVSGGLLIHSLSLCKYSFCGVFTSRCVSEDVFSEREVFSALMKEEIRKTD